MKEGDEIVAINGEPIHRNNGTKGSPTFCTEAITVSKFSNLHSDVEGSISWHVMLLEFKRHLDLVRIQKE